MKALIYFTVFMLMPQFAGACQSCFGANVNTATTQGIEVAMLALLGITGFVSAGIVMFFLNMRKRSKIHSLRLDSGQSKTELVDELLDKINERGGERLRQRLRLRKPTALIKTLESDAFKNRKKA